MKKLTASILRIVLLLLLIAGAGAFVIFIIFPSRPAWAAARTLSDAMTNARSVTLVEFERNWAGRELVFQRVTATPNQISSLRSATGAWIAPVPPWSTACFEPHHRVEVVCAEGSVFRFEVCFHCRNFQLVSADKTTFREMTLPPSWRSRLEKFFTDAGMAPRDDYSDVAKKHPDYDRFKDEEDHPFGPPPAEAPSAQPKEPVLK